jgi:hypothetical protein
MWLNSRPPTESLPPLKGFVDALVLKPANSEREALRLTQPGALPMRPVDQVRVEAELNRPAYLYLVWIDSTGHATPLYPWKSGRWGGRSGPEAPVTHLSLPDDRQEGWELAGSDPGMETVLLLAREERLPREVELASFFSALPRPGAQNMHAAVWFENGTVVRDEGERAFTAFDPAANNDPLLRMQADLLRRLQPHFPCIRAVSFANAGK